jgi:diguanylate cyclase (GGDEF)-like protein
MATVLIVDDLPENLRQLSRYFVRENHEVVTATCGEETIQAAQKLHPDVILLDIMMPGIDGIETCRQLKADDRTRAIPVILVTALDRDTDVVKGLEAGADDYVTKPYNFTILNARTNAAIHRYEMVRENESLLREVQLAATTDSLTGLLKRRTFFDRLGGELSRAARHHLPLSCVMLDIDDFKKINDDHGHVAGDCVLAAIAAMLQDACRKSDHICRYGGEEFCVLLSHTAEQDAVEWAERLREQISRCEVTFGDEKLRVSASFGVADRLDDANTPEQMTDLADQALLVAKRSGRNCVIPYSALDDTLSLQDYRGDCLQQPYEGVTAHDVMASPIFCLPQDATLRQAAEMLLQLRINSIPIVDEDGCLVGILSERDVIDVAAKTGNWQLPLHHKMTRKVVQFSADAPARTIHDFLCRNGIRRVVVSDEQGCPVGVISRANLLRRLRNWQPLDMPDADATPLKPDYRRFNQDVSMSAAALAGQLRRLQDAVHDGANDFGADVVDIVSKTQELATHLLTQSRAAVTRDFEKVPAVEPWVG